MKKNLLLSIAFMFVFGLSLQAQQTKRIYMMGNSVTDGVNYDGFKAMALSQGNAHIWARQNTPGAPLGMLWDQHITGAAFTTAPFGPPKNAFENYDWDVVTLQPFDRGIADDKQVILNFAGLIKEKSPDVQFYIYSRYPRTPSGKTELTATAEDWKKLWEYTYGAGGQSNEHRAFFEELCNQFNTTDKGGLNKNALIIPVGDVMYAFNEKAMAGETPGISRVWDIYSDGIHVNNIGSYLIMGTFYSTIYKEDIRGTKVPANYGTIDPALVEVIQQTIYEVVFTHPYSGTSVADLVPVEGVELDQNTLSMSVFNRTQLVATVSPANAAKKGVIWNSDDTNVAMVNNKGQVTSLSEGTATITARTLDGDFFDQCIVTVSGVVTGTTLAGTLATWNFGTEGKKSWENNWQPAGNVLDGIGYTIAFIGQGMDADGWDNCLSGTGQTTLDLVSSIADGEYIAFTIKPEKGKILSIEKVQFAPLSQNRERRFVLMSSVNGFVPGEEIYTVGYNGWGNLQSVDITGHSNLDEVEFRVYIYGHDNVYESAGLGTRGSGSNDFVITGSVFTPSNEPPSEPENIRAIDVKDTYITFEWDESNDDFFVKGYNFYLNGEKKNSDLIETTNFTLEGLSSGQLCEVEVEAIDFFELESTKGSFSIYANRPPIAAITPSVTSGKIPLTVTFTSNDSYDPDEDEGDYVLGFDWYIDGQIQTDNGNTFIPTFTQRGEYEVSLVVVDTRGMRSVTPSKTTIQVTADKYTITVNGGVTLPAVTEAYAGDAVTITADDPAEGMAFDKWTSNDGIEFADATAIETTFTMPDKAVTVTATYKTIEYNITVINGSGPAVSAFGATVTITANDPAEGMAFDKWTSNDGIEFANATATETTFIMPTNDVTVTANYIEIIGVVYGDMEAIVLYPNPAADYVVISGLQSDNYSIVDVAGATILTGTSYSGEGINVSSLAPGWYIFRADGNALPFVKK